MKKVITIISIAAIALVMVFSCSKENATDKPAAKQELTAYDVYINKTLKDFKQKMEFIRANPNLKSGESVPADSAVWLLEATINFSHAFPNEFYSEFETDSLTLTVARNADGTVDLNELTIKYDEMKQAVADAYHNSGYEVKGLAVVDLEEVVISESEIEINVQVLTGDKSNDPPPGPFVEGDDWYYGENAGKCGQASTDDFDAAQRLYEEASNTIPDPNGNYGFVGPFIEKDIAGDDDTFIFPNDPQPQDNHLDRYLFYATTEYGVCGDDTLCVEYPEMNTYFFRLKYLMYHYYLDNPNMADYDIMCITQFDDYWAQYSVGTNYYTKYFHKGKLKFGIKVYRSDNPEEL